MSQTVSHQNKYYLIRGILIVLGGIAVNLLGSFVATTFRLPVYLDSLGTVLVSVMGGYMPGVIVGFLSNLINGLNDPINTYYAVISVLIAIACAYYGEHGYFKKLWTSLLVVFPLVVIGGFLGSLLTYLINGFGIGTGISSGLAHSILNGGRMSLFFSQLSSDMLYDLLDKTVTVLLTFVILKLIPESLQHSLRFHGWRQTPLSPEERELAFKSVNSRKSLRSKLLMIISAASIFIAVAITSITFVLYRRATFKDRIQVGSGIVRLVESVIDGNRIDEFIELGYKAEGYQKIEDELERIRSTSEDILYVYVYRIEEDGCHVVFDLDTEDLPGAEPGEIMEFDASFEPVLDKLLAGEPIEPLVTNDTFGWLLTMYEPIRDSNGVTQAYACIDISMAQVALNEMEFLVKVIVLFIGFLLMIVYIGLWLSDYNLILPINSMAIAADHFTSETEEGRRDSIEHFRNLDIRTGDEIENLYQSFRLTIEETVEYIANIQKQSDTISRMQNGLILVLADMVESRDKCTGDHVRKTAAYCRIILEQMRRDGIYRDQLTDEYINDVVNSAPLHDVGKIKISDTILNKPGKLTDEEFNEMKKHTLAGNEIIQQAMELVSSDSGYLKEAKNLATYHHEKWNGSGYPMGLKGEDIPLSARVMAVADVFDALVSKRSYKEPFSFEKAVSIIEEGSGNHFDPSVVKAFLEVKDKAQKIAKANLAQSGGMGHTMLMETIRENESAAS